MPLTHVPLTEDLIREADGLFLGLLRNALIGVYIIQNGLFRYVNPRFAEMFGYAQKDICGRFGPADLIEPQDLDKVQEAIDKRIDGSAETAHYTFHGAHREGRALELEVFGTRTEFAGKPAIIGMLIDITARRAAERTATEQLNFTAQLIEAIPSPLFFKDEQGRYVGCNKAFEAFLGSPRDAIIGRTVFDLSPPDLAQRYHAADQALLDNPGVQTYEASVESAGGQRRDVIYNKATYLKADGQLGGLVGVITDITQRKQTGALIWMQANYDALTGLPNRRLLNDRLAELVKRTHRSHDCVAVMFIDLDRFKEVNDTLGHEAGDRLLVEAARRIVACLRESDTVARQGGDEFTVLLPGMAAGFGQPAGEGADEVGDVLCELSTVGQVVLVVPHQINDLLQLLGVESAAKQLAEIHHDALLRIGWVRSYCNLGARPLRTPYDSSAARAIRASRVRIADSLMRALCGVELSNPKVAWTPARASVGSRSPRTAHTVSTQPSM